MKKFLSVFRRIFLAGTVSLVLILVFFYLHINMPVLNVGGADEILDQMRSLTGGHAHVFL